MPDTNPTAKSRHSRGTGEVASPFRRRLLRQWAFSRLEWGDIPGAVDLALDLAAMYPDDETPALLADKAILMMSQLPPAQYTPSLQVLTRLPIVCLNFHALSPAALQPIRGMCLQDLGCGDSALTDLSPLQGMPLRHLDVRRNAITDLAPLAGMPLQELNCADNRIRDLTPLQGMPLKNLECQRNLIRDLSPLASLPLENLLCESNQLSDLTPLKNLPIQVLHCANNQLSDLTHLSALPLIDLNCAYNRITDLTPLRHIPLRDLDCQGNRIGDLSPLHGLPLKHLFCSDNPLTSLLPLDGMDIEFLAVEGIPLDMAGIQVLLRLPLQHVICDISAETMAVLQSHGTLHGFNEHNVAYVRAYGTPLHTALHDWRQGNADGTLLRSLATPCGSVRYLSVPIRLSWPQAVAFCRYCRGTLACPATEEQYQALLQYLTSVIYAGCTTSFHLGLTADPETGEMRWLSKAPYQWGYWPYPPANTHFRRPGTPYFTCSVSGVGAYWCRNTDPDARYYFVIEWPEASVTSMLPAPLRSVQDSKHDEPLQRARVFLQEYLQCHPSAPATEVYAQARRHHIAERTLQRAKKLLGVISVKSPRFVGTWLWCLSHEDRHGDLRR